MSEKIEAKVTHRFAAGPEEIYDTILDPARVRRWQEAWLRHSGLTSDITICEIDPREGGKFLFADRRGGEEARHWGSFLALERPTRISFTWIVDPGEQDDPSIVTIIIEPEPEGTGGIVTLYHSMDAQWADWLAQTEKGWIAMLAGIEDTIQSGESAARA